VLLESKSSILFLLKNIQIWKMTTISEIIAFTIPSLITGGVAWFFYLIPTLDQQKYTQTLLQRHPRRAVLPTCDCKLNERMILFKRINPSNWWSELHPIPDDEWISKPCYCTNRAREFEHNLAQQIYVTEECWSIILAAKMPPTNGSACS
jgi:hypothetical protein